MSALVILIASRAILENPERWCQDDFARDAQRKSVKPRDSSAARWCSLGALTCASAPFDSTLQEEAEEYLGYAAGLEFEETIEDWNDSTHRTHAEVLAAFDKAIEQARAGIVPWGEVQP